MIKPLIILLNTISVILFSLFFGDTPVTIIGNFPKAAKVATEFVSEIKVNKGSAAGFAKIQLEVPQGFTVKGLESVGGEFSFTNNIAKIIWTSMPNDAEFTLKFSITADASAAGLKTITSKFSYVNNNNKEVVEMTPTEIMIGEVPTVSQDSATKSETTSITTNTAAAEITETVSTNNSSITASAFESQVEPSLNVVCSRAITNASAPNSYNVEVRIKKGEIKGFAKFQEVLPLGYNAKADKTNGSSASISDGKLKFVWVSLPSDNELVLSYILEKMDPNTQDSKLNNGEFSYLENEQSKKVKLSIDILNNNQTYVAETPVQTSTIVAEQTATTQSSTNPPTEIQKETITKKEGNVMYLVQIGAFKNAIQSDVLSKKFKLTETVNSEMAEGFNKFMVGNFNEYKLARNYREEIKQKGCTSAFVVAYNGSKRITVQEALMITSQKWFK